MENPALNKKAYAQLVELQKVNSLLLSARTLEKVGKIIVSGGFLAIGATSGDIILLSDNKKEYKLLAYIGYPKSFLKKFPSLSLKTPLLTNYVIHTKRPYFVKNISQLDAKYKMAKMFWKLSGANATALFPLKINGKVVGVLQFTFPDSESFTIENQKFMDILANQCVQAIDRIIRLNDLKKAKRKLETMLKKLAQ